ncbi:calcium sensing receptor, chloroplastic [Malania oleifera]|uniref:calcium sensing receptor, chloroplastic n=1 Tax=Malania oleifera TaxID=397392 RepID=UPI0025AE2240|nr:calcium sensing receptor, chloroplastic [Malania oleifera]
MGMEMTLQGSTSAKPSLSLPSPLLSTPKSASSLLKPPPGAQFRPISISLPASTAISLFALFSPPHEAKALSLPKEQIVSSITEAEKTIGQVQEVGLSLFDTAQHVFQAVASALKPGVDAAVPIVSQAGEQAVRLASPALSEALKKAREAIQSSGFDTEPVLSAAKTVADAAQKTTKVIEEAKPIASSTVETISTADPILVVGTAGALFLSYLLLPPIWSVISFSLRGYKGELTPAQTLDLVSTKNHLLIDIRSEKDKDESGVPRLPSNAKSKMVAIPLEELPSRLKGLVRNVKKVEAEMVALKISYLKKIGRGSNIVIMDSYTDAAKIVARALTNLGFKNCWIMADGFSGRRGWLQSRLGTDSYNFSFAEVLSPSRVIPAVVRRFGTTSSTNQSSQKLLPGRFE